MPVRTKVLNILISNNGNCSALWFSGSCASTEALEDYDTVGGSRSDKGSAV